jgi:hypothetical protein
MYKVEWKSVSKGTGGKKVEYHCSRVMSLPELALFTSVFQGKRHWVIVRGIFEEGHASRAPEDTYFEISQLEISFRRPSHSSNRKA